MKLKQFFINNKSKIKEVLECILYALLALIIFFSVFSLGYAKGSSNNSNIDSNKRELVIKKETYYDNFTSSNLMFQIGTMAPYNRLTQYFEFYYNINYINFGIDQYGVEININYDLVTRVKYQNGINFDYWAFMNPVQFDTYYNMDTQAITDYPDLECVRIDFNTTQIVYEDGWDDSDAYFDLSIDDEINIYLNNIADQEHNWVFTSSQSTGLDASNLPVSVQQSINSIISDIDDVGCITDERRNSFIFNTTYGGYGDGFIDGSSEGYTNGYEEGVTDQTDYYEDLIIPVIKEEWFNNGYQEGLAEGRAENNAILKPFELMILGVEPMITVLSSEIAPGITIGTIALIPLAVTMIVFLLKGLVM